MRKRHSRVRLPALVLAGAFVLGSCASPFFNKADEAVGVRGPSPGSVEVQVALCPGQTVGKLELFEMHGQVVGDEDDRLLWAISADPPSAQSLYVVGQVPPGFKETTPSKAPIPSDQQLAVVVTLSTGDAGLSFRLSDLNATDVFSVGGSMDPAAFRQRAQDACGS